MDSTSIGPLRERALQVFDRLQAYYDPPTWRSPLPPIDELISTILSQNTNDRNRDAAFTNLKARFPTWEAVRDAPEAAVIDAIRTAGLANQKAPRIQTLLREISRERGNLDLGFLSGMEVGAARAWLTHFKGVGPKTAAIVLLFSLDRPAFPVDTHIYRVTGRIGLRPEKLNLEQAHVFLEALFPPETYFSAHLNLIRLGREICHPHHPECTRCPVLAVCSYGQAATNTPVS